MSYTLTCPDPECNTTFELEDSAFDPIYETGGEIVCPDCQETWEWDYDPEAPDGEEVTLKCGACQKPECECEIEEDGMALVETEEDDPDAEEE